MPIFTQTDLAKEDLLKIWLYIARDSIQNADSFIDKIEAKYRLLAENPLIGTEHLGFSIPLRSFPVDNYLIFFNANENGIEIYRILNAARDVAKLL